MALLDTRRWKHRSRQLAASGIVAMAIGVAGATTAGATTAGATTAGATTSGATTAGATGNTSWPAYLYTPNHSSDALGSTAITPSNASTLTQAWNWLPPGTAGNDQQLISSPTVVGGVVYIGSNNGTFYALRETTGAVIWSHTIGKTNFTTCGSRGFASTATVTDDPVTKALTVYVAAPDGYLYAFNAKTGATVWSSLIGLPSTTQNDYFNWSSPAVANGKVYVGITSMCDLPLVRGGIIEVDQHLGTRLGQYYTVPAGSIGGSVWSSPAVSGSGDVYFTTGNGPPGNEYVGNSDSIVEVTGSLAFVASWQIPTHGSSPDSDFGGSPTMFFATTPGSVKQTPMVGACNKNGNYYALNRDDLAAGPVWTLKVGSAPSKATKGAECIAAAAYNGHDLFIAGPLTTVGATQYNGSIREVDPTTGDVVWATGLPGAVVGSPSLNGAGLLSVPSYDFSGAPNADSLVNSSTGALVATISTGGGAEFCQPIFAGRDLLLGTWSTGLFDYRLPPV